ncbi:MAG TPA: hypothetical protein VKA85_02385 [Candidatus Limnocylindrales bacterium]|nr:hypothetical protein [Candidatus Limnocylindrales bacterium]
MAARGFRGLADPGFTLPALERVAPPPSPDVVGDRIDRHTDAGDVVLDLHARGGWIARAAVDRDRRAVSIESAPLTRVLAEIVLRPPDVRHLDAAFQALANAPGERSTVRQEIADAFATRCATCDRAVVADELVWEAHGRGAPAVPVRKEYGCGVCRDQRGGAEVRHAPVDAADIALAAAGVDAAAATRAAIAERFPVPDGHDALAAELVALHTDRQLAGLAAILARIEQELRAEPVEAALRLAFVGAVLPASRLAGSHGAPGTLRISAGRVRSVPGGQWRERNPWVAFEDGFRAVRTFVQELESGQVPHLPARFGGDLQSLVDGGANVVVRLGGPSALRSLEADAAALADRPVRPKARLVLGQGPPRPTQESTAVAFVTTAWALGRDAAATLPVEALLAGPVQVPWGWQAAALRRSLDAVAPLLDVDARAVILVDGTEPEAVVAATLGGVGAGFRLLAAKLAEPDEAATSFVELLPPGAAVPPAARTRANVALPALPGGAGDPDLVQSPGVFARPERYDARPFSATEAARAVSEAAVAVLRARGEPARTERLLGEILVALDRSGQLRRLVDSAPPRSLGGGSGGPATAPTAAGDHVDALLALIRDELTRRAQRRLVEVAPGTWWLTDRDDIAGSAAPLADRAEWAVYSVLSTAGQLSEAAFLDRIATLFGEHDVPDEALISACLESYRSADSTAERLATDEDLVRRSREHGDLLAALADGGHRLRMNVWLGLREQSRRVGDRRLGDVLDDRERNVPMSTVARGPIDALEAVDCIWYVRNRAAFAFEVEWTAMLGDTVLRRHARIPADDRLIRFLVVPGERTELLRHKIARSPLLRAALDEGNWHVLKWDYLRAFLARSPLDIDDLEPYLGLDPEVEGAGRQMPLFDLAR